MLKAYDELKTKSKIMVAPGRETKEEFSFKDAIHECLNYGATKSTFSGLMPLGKLRHFK